MRSSCASKGRFIVSPEPVESKRLETEFQRIDRELEVITRLNRVRSSRELDEIELRAAASALHATYNGIERLLTIALRHKGINPPEGSAYHQELLNKAESSVIVPKELKDRLRNLMGFRHFYRHAYGFMIQADMIAPLLEDVGSTVEALRNHLLSETE